MTLSLSIVTPCLDRAAFVAEAVESVAAQDVSAEHIVADGGSTDGTLAVLARYPHLKLTVEPDRGLYDALNKAIRRASGDIIGLLNTDDLYEPGCFGAVLAAFEADASVDMVCGVATVFRVADGQRKTVRTLAGARYQGLSWPTVTAGIPIINARFFRRAVFDRIGLFDLAYPLTADRDFLIRSLMAGLSNRAIDATVYHYREHPGSLTINGGTQGVLRGLREKMAMARAHLEDPALPEEARRWLREWHAWEACEAVRHGLMRGQFSDAAAAALAGCRLDALWPARFAWAAAVMLGLSPVKPRILG